MLLLPHLILNKLLALTLHEKMQKLPDDDLLMILTCGSPTPSFSLVTWDKSASYLVFISHLHPVFALPAFPELSLPIPSLKS